MITDEVYDFGLRMKELRKRKGLTQGQLGDLLGISRATIYRYENNTQTPSLAKIVSLALYLNTSTDYLVGLEDEPVVKISGLSPQKKQVMLDFINYLF